MSSDSQFIPQPFPPHVRAGRDTQRPFDFFSGKPYPPVNHPQYYDGGWDSAEHPPQHFYNPPPHVHYSHHPPGPAYPQVFPSYIPPPYPAPPPPPCTSTPYALHPCGDGHSYPPYFKHGRPLYPMFPPHSQPHNTYPPSARPMIDNADIDTSRLGYALPVSGRPIYMTSTPAHPPRVYPSTSSPHASSTRRDTHSATDNIPMRRPARSAYVPASPSGNTTSLLFSESTTPTPRPITSSISTARVQASIDQIVMKQEEAEFHRNATPTAPLTLPQTLAGSVRPSYAQVVDRKKPEVHPTIMTRPEVLHELDATPPPSIPPRFRLSSPGSHPFAHTPMGNFAIAKGKRLTVAAKDQQAAPGPSSSSTKATRLEVAPSRDSQITPTPSSVTSSSRLDGGRGGGSQTNPTNDLSPLSLMPPAPHNTPNEYQPVSTPRRPLPLPPAPNRAPSPSQRSTPINRLGGSTPTKNRLVKVPYLMCTSPTPKKNASWERQVDERLLKVPQLNLSTGRLHGSIPAGNSARGSDVFDGGYTSDSEESSGGGKGESWVPDSPLSEHQDGLNFFSAPPSPSPATTSVSLPEEDDGGDVCVWFDEQKDGSELARRGVSLLECAHLKAFLREQEGNPLKERLKLREIDMIFQWDELPMTKRTIPVSLLGVKIERPELALIIARVCVMYFRKHMHHPSAPDVTRLRLLGARTESRSVLVPILVEE